MAQKEILLIIYIGLLLSLPDLSAQNHHRSIHSKDSILTIEIPSVSDLEKKDRQLGLAARFASPIATDIDPTTHGHWTEETEYMVWQLSIHIPTAKGIYLAFDQLNLSEGAALLLYDRHHNLIDAFYQDGQINKSKCLLSANRCDFVQLKLRTGKSNFFQDQFNLFKLFHAYKSVEKESAELSMLSCHLNSSCIDDPVIESSARGTIRVLRYFEEGLAWCSAALVNNTRQDKKPYVLTAYHCIDGLEPDFDLWRFDFNYSSLDCAGEISSERIQYLLGARFRAGRQASDFLLLELEDDIPMDYQPYFLGWNNTESLPLSTVGFHHPRGAVRKAALDTERPILQDSEILWNNKVSTPGGHHLVVEFDHGAQELGSSGGPLVNEKGQLIGQLHGGNSNCQGNKSYYGWLAKSWSAGEQANERLDFWLDPDQLGLTELNALTPGNKSFAVSGKLINQYGQTIPDVEVELTTVDAQRMICKTDENGNYFFTNLLASTSHAIRPLLANDQPGEIILKVNNGKKEATFSARKVAIRRSPISQQTIAKESGPLHMIFERVYPNQIDIIQMNNDLRNLNFTVIK